MSDPLVYGEHTRAINELIEQGLGNTGLIWDRYFPNIERDKNNYNSLYNFVERLSKTLKQHQEHILHERQLRYKRAIKQLARSRKLDHIFYEARLTWRFATGLGNDHPTDNGFSFDHTTGLPLIAGTMIKGMCRAAASPLGWDETEIERLFGPDEILSGISVWQGRLFFFDAFLFEWPNLTVDITNCHHQTYYGDTASGHSNSSKTSPRETVSPNPVHYISVTSASFLFPLLVPEEEKVRIEELLNNALSLFGIGAKTSVGYGRFSISGEKNRRRPEE